MAENTQRRENFRIVYPQAEMPKATIGADTYRVIDLGAAGIKIDADKKVDKFSVKSGVLKVNLALLCGKKIEVLAEYFRTSGTGVVLTLTTEIPSALINQEQVYLRSKYPGFK